eukprot:2674853-Pyramimonas_sp.AAC.1
MEDLIRFCKLLDAQFKGWKQDVPARSRYYSINTSSLIPSPRWIFRGVSNVYVSLLSPIRNASDAATRLRDNISDCGGFITRHLASGFED